MGRLNASISMVVLAALVIVYDLTSGRCRRGLKYWAGFLAVAALYIIRALQSRLVLSAKR